MLKEMTVLAFDSAAAKAAITIQNELKTQRRSIDKADLFIAATAVANSLPLATLNRKHFTHIEHLELIAL